MLNLLLQDSACWSKLAPRKFFAFAGRCVFFFSPQTIIASGKNAFGYDNFVPEQTVYAYVRGNPLTNVDQSGLRTLQLGGGGMWQHGTTGGSASTYIGGDTFGNFCITFEYCTNNGLGAAGSAGVTLAGNPSQESKLCTGQTQSAGSFLAGGAGYFGDSTVTYDVPLPSTGVLPPRPPSDPTQMTVSGSFGGGFGAAGGMTNCQQQNYCINLLGQ